MHRYAQIDSNGIVIGDSQLSSEVNHPNMIPISDDFDTTNKKYVNGEWVEYIPEPVTESLIDTQQTILETAINTDYLVCLADLGL